MSFLSRLNRMFTAKGALMSWDANSSPFQPGRSGKIQKPPEQSEQESHGLRGCGDPTCSMCNPETAAAGLGNGGSSDDGRVWRTVSLDPSAFTVRSGDRGGMISFELNASPFGEATNAPPSSYRNARAAVEKWLVTAPDQAFDDIVGNDSALAQLRDAIQAPVKHKAVYEAYGMKMPKGAMLSGPPGCGKTMFARAAASEMRRLYGDKVEFISISGAELQSPFIGVTEGYIKSIFTFAREYRNYHGHPLLVFMDEAEVLLPDRTGRVRRLAPWEESQVATFLAEMDGIQESGAFMLLASNRPEVIDQAVLRDGRCDFKIVVKRPSPDAIEIILRKNFVGTLTGADDIERLVFAAVEGLLDPAKILMEAHAIKIDFAEQKVTDHHRRHFLLEHIVSGAMAASIPQRAKRHAFARDKLAGIAKGVTVSDVLQAVNDLFEENKGLEHSFALNEFKADLMRDAQAAAR